MWFWVFVFGGIAVVGLVMLICYAVWLAHKTADVFSELTVVADRSGQILDLLGQIQVPQSIGMAGADGARIVGDRDDEFV